MKSALLILLASLLSTVVSLYCGETILYRDVRLQLDENETFEYNISSVYRGNLTSLSVYSDDIMYGRHDSIFSVVLVNYYRSYPGEAVNMVSEGLHISSRYMNKVYNNDTLGIIVYGHTNQTKLTIYYTIYQCP